MFKFIYAAFSGLLFPGNIELETAQQQPIEETAAYSNDNTNTSDLRVPPASAGFGEHRQLPPKDPVFQDLRPTSKTPPEESL